MDDHTAAYAAESMPPTVWERWINDVEALLGVSADGDVRTDGFSMDTFHDMFKAGMLPAQAAIRVVGALWVSTDGCAVRLREAQSWIDGDYRERWIVSEPDSGSYSPSKPVTLVGCRLVWHPVWGTNIPAAVRQAADRTQGKDNR